MVKYAYIKNGDAVAQLSSIAEHPETKTTSGPNAFIKDFLTNINSEPIIIVSLHKKFEKYYFKNMKSYVFNSGSSFLGKILLRPVSLLLIFFTLLFYKPDRILCGSTGAIMWVGFLISRILRIPMVHSRHNRVTSNNDSWHRKIRSLIDKSFIVRMKAVIVHGPYLKNELLDIGVEKSRLYEFDVGFEDLLEIDTDVDLSEFNITESDRELILFIGRVEKNKGIFDLLKAFKHVLLNNKEYQLIYIGDGSDLSKLQDLIEVENINNHVHIIGSIKHSELPGIIRQSSLIVTPTQPSFPEGRCMVVMESLVLGVPVIAPNFGPFPYLVKHEDNGLLYRPGSVTDLQEKLESFVTDESLKIKLKNGAIATGKKYINPNLTFSQAVSKAFA